MTDSLPPILPATNTEVTELVTFLKTNPPCLAEIMELNLTYQVENLNCPHCGATHSDIDKWALKPHKTHLCLNCGEMFEGTVKAISHPHLSQEYVLSEIENMPDNFYIEDVDFTITYKDHKVTTTPRIDADGDLYWVYKIEPCEGIESGIYTGEDVGEYDSDTDFLIADAAISYGCREIDRCLEVV